MHSSKLFLSSVILASVLLGSCNSKNNESTSNTDTTLKSALIVVSDLNEICDFVQAFSLCIDDYTTVYHKTKYENLSAAEQKKIDRIDAKLDAILLAADQKNFNLEQVSECENWKDLVYQGKLLFQYRKTPADLQLQALKTPCDYLSQYELVTDSVTSIMHYRKFSELKINEIKKVILVMQNIVFIGNYGQEQGIQSSDLMSCENYGPVINKLSVLDKMQQ